MTRKLVLVDVGPGETRVALMEEGRLVEIAFERAAPDDEQDQDPRESASLVGAILLARVSRLLPGIDAAFLDIGQSRPGFLAARDARSLPIPGNAEKRDQIAPPIVTLLQEGQGVLVQVTKDPVGEKGAQLTTAATLAGRLLILMPDQDVVALSRRITDPAERPRLEALARSLGAAIQAQEGLNAGLILRTAAQAAREADLREEAHRLANDWLTIKARAAQAKAPCVLHRDLGIVGRTLRDHLAEDTEAILVNDPATLRALQRYAAETTPALTERIVDYRDATPLFEAYGVEAALEALQFPRVALPSGGWITIEATEALTAIDVNSGSLAGACRESTSFTTNEEAARAVGRALRLRGIGGLVVVDFIHMEEAAHIEMVLETLRATLAADRVPFQMSGMSMFGLVEITRKRMRTGVAGLLMEPCASCGGRARRLTAATIANILLRRLEAELRQGRSARGLRARLAPDIAAWLALRKRTVLGPLEARFAREIRLEPMPGYPRERADFEPLEHGA